MLVRSLVFVLPDTGGGGIFQFVEQLACSLQSFVQVKVVLADPFHPMRITMPPGVEVHCVDPALTRSLHGQFQQGPLAAYPSIIRMLSLAFAAWHKVEELQPDIAELCEWPLSLTPAVLSQSIPSIVQCHASMGQIAAHDPQRGGEVESAILQLIEPQLMAAAHRVQSPSQANATFWHDFTGRPVQMIRPAFALPEIASGDTEISDFGAVFGRLQRWKGPHILCAALQHLGAAAPTIDWYGAIKPWDSSSMPADTRLKTDYPDIWDARLRHYPPVARDIVARLQAGALFNVVPSTWDVFNFTAVESMAGARPTIVSTGAGASELIVDGENGFTFENQNAESLAHVLDRVLTMPEKRRREIGHAGRETIGIELAPARIAQQRLDAYHEAISSYAAAPPKKPNPWLTELLTPRPNGTSDAGAILDLLPIKTITAHIQSRLLGKLGWKKPGL